MTYPKPSRRRFLRQAAAAAMALPAVQWSFARVARGQASRAPLRFLVLYNSLGVPHEARPEFLVRPAQGPLGELKPILQPLAAFKDQLVVVTGCDVATAFDQDVGGHPAGTAQGLTGTKMVDSSSRSAIRSLGPSIDVAIGDGIGGGTPYKSLQLNVGGFAGNGQMGASFGNDGRQLPRIRGAANIFQAVFGDLPSGEGPNLDPTLEALSYATDRVNELGGQLRGEGRKRVLEAYRDSVHEVAERIAGTAELECEVGEAPGQLGLRADIVRTLSLVRNVFACDLSRSVFLDIGGSSSRLEHPWMTPAVPQAAANTPHHSLSHDRTDAAFRTMCMIRAGFAELYAGFLSSLASTPDVGGDTLLDNTVILWATETATGARHRLDDLPLVLVAGKNAGIKQGGHHVVADGRPVNDLHTALLRTFGLPSERFGDPGFNTGPLDIFA